MIATLEVLASQVPSDSLVCTTEEREVTRALSVIEGTISTAKETEMPALAVVLGLHSRSPVAVTKAIEGGAVPEISRLVRDHAPEVLKGVAEAGELRREESMNTEVAVHDHNIVNALGESELVIDQSCSHFDTLYLHKQGS